FSYFPLFPYTTLFRSPEAPDPGIPDLRPGVAGIGLPQHLLRHRGGMVGEIAAGAGDAGAVWARRMHLNGGRGEHERRAARVLLRSEEHTSELQSLRHL